MSSFLSNIKCAVKYVLICLFLYYVQSRDFLLDLCESIHQIVIINWTHCIILSESIFNANPIPNNNLFVAEKNCLPVIKPCSGWNRASWKSRVWFACIAKLISWLLNHNLILSYLIVQFLLKDHFWVSTILL